MKTVKIGRIPTNNDIVLDHKDSVSRYHCTITQDDNGQYFIEDHSKHGTTINGGLLRNTKMPLSVDSTVEVEGFVLPWLNYFIKKKHDRIAPPIETYDLSVDAEAEYGALKQSVILSINDYKTKLHAQKQNNYHSFSDELLSHAVESYNQNFAALTDFLTKVASQSVAIQHKYDKDMQLLENLRIQKMMIDPMQGKKVDANEIFAIEQRKIAVTKQIDEQKSETRTLLNEAVQVFEEKFPLLFENQYETATVGSKIWNKLEKQNVVPASNLFIGKNNVEFTLFDEKFAVRKNEYLALLNTQNVIIRHNTDSKQRCLNFVNTLTGRLLTAAMSGNLSVSMIDAEEMDGTCDEFKRLNKSIFNICAREEDIVRQLEDISRHIENIIQNVLHGNIRSLADYNQGKENVEGYKLLIVESFPVGLNSRATQLLKKILKNGVRAGVNVLLLVDEDQINRSEENQKIFNAFNIESIENECAVFNFTNAQSINFEDLSSEQLYRIVQHTNKGFETKKEEVLKLSDYLIPQEEWWSHNSGQTLEVPFGLSSRLSPESLQITQEFGQNSAIVIGIPGSGKSVFLNTFITNSAIHYSPDELELYLIDFSGVEFNIYTEPILPHAKVIAPESEREFGISILRKLRAIGKEREELCRNAGVSNIIEYRQKKPDVKMPRIVAVVDEFQKFFQADDGKFTDNIYYEAKDIITVIIREYRKYGINIILATQTMKGEPTIGMDMIANRIVFKCVPDDIHKLFVSDGNYIVSQIAKTGECIYNSRAGDANVMYNKKIMTFYAPRKEQIELLEQIYAFAESKGKAPKKEDVHIFRSADVPALKKEKHFTKLSEKRSEEEINVWLGELIELSAHDAKAVLRKESSANMLIVGGDTEIAKTLAINCTASLVYSHLETKTSAEFFFFNFMRKTDAFFATPEELYRDIPFEKHFIFDDTAEITNALKNIKETIDKRSDKSEPQDHIYISFYDMHAVEAFRSANPPRPSEAWTYLDYILKNGSSVGVFMVMQVDTPQRLKQVFSSNPMDFFNHRVALQMSKTDSDKILTDSHANANLLTIESRPHTKNRAFYFNPKENIIRKFKPYKMYKV